MGATSECNVSWIDEVNEIVAENSSSSATSSNLEVPITLEFSLDKTAGGG